jgi:small-conductance mechanosensitive channel
LLQNTNPTNYLFLRHATVGVIYVVGFGLAFYQLPNFRTLASGLLTGAGILAVAVGFASQQALSNIVGGTFIVIFKPFKVNDRLTIGTRSGIVEDITLRHTVIRDFENRRIIIPNSVISDEVIVNSDFVDGEICRLVDVTISYESDLDRAKAIMAEIVGAHSLLLDRRTPEQLAEGEPLVPVRVLHLTELGVHLRAWAWVKDNNDAFLLSCDVLETLKKAFDAAGVEIAYPYRGAFAKSNPVAESKNSG